jgi:DNA-binding Xre family transcriptional regulator
MRCYNQLEKILQRGNRKYKNSEIAAATGLTEYQIRQLRKNEAKWVNMGHLAKICQFLIREKLATLSELPGLLFALVPDEFWPRLAEREEITLSVGVRFDTHRNNDFLVDADSKLRDVVMESLTEEAREVGQTPKLVPTSVNSWRANNATSTDIQKEARQHYREFARRRVHNALVVIGTMKVNPIFDLVLETAFPRAHAFTSEDTVAWVGDRSCPFFIRYKEESRHPESCAGGQRLSSDDAGDGPGIYWESDPVGYWDHIPCSADTDGALVFYCFHKPQGRLEMILGGYSLRATQCLATLLRNEGAECFTRAAYGPSEAVVYSDGEVEMAAFVVRFWFAGNGVAATPAAPRNRRPAPYRKHQVIPLKSEVLRRRRGGTAMVSTLSP